MAKQRDDGATFAHGTGCGDCVAGGSLGLLLGTLMGLSATPVASIVITALVALLAGLFGLSESLSLSLSRTAMYRLTAFSLAATLATPCAVWLRTNGVLEPSVERHRAILREIGYPDGSKEQSEALRYAMFGLLPATLTAGKDSQRERAGVLYGDTPAGLCDDLSRVHNADDLVLVLSRSDAHLRAAADAIRMMPTDQRGAAVQFAKLFLCDEH